MIINLGPALAVRTPGDGVWRDHQQGFIAGLHDTYAITDSGGAQAGVEVNLTPAGARLLLGLPMRDLRGQVVILEAALGTDGPRLRERLLEALDWEKRFAMIDEFLLARIADREPPAASLSRAPGASTQTAVPLTLDR